MNESNLIGRSSARETTSDRGYAASSSQGSETRCLECEGKVRNVKLCYSVCTRCGLVHGGYLC